MSNPFAVPRPPAPVLGSRSVPPCSGSYAALARLPGAVGVDVIAEHADGRRSVVSHFNEAHKGRLARALAATRSEPDDVATVASVARRAGMRVERKGADLTVVVPA